MRAGIVSAACLGLVFLLLAIHGASGGSDGFWMFWYLVWLAAVVLAIAAIVSATRAGISRQARVTALVLGFAVLGITGCFVWAILSLLEHVR